MKNFVKVMLGLFVLLLSLMASLVCGAMYIGITDGVPIHWAEPLTIVVLVAGVWACGGLINMIDRSKPW